VDAFSRRLRRLRQARGWSQAALAERAALSRLQVIRIETGQQEPTLGVIRRLAKALRVKPGALLE
jgi:transcriptional regulator with XRE-family HTH domain